MIKLNYVVVSFKITQQWENIQEGFHEKEKRESKERSKKINK